VRTDAGSDPEAGRYRHYGQSAGPQGAGIREAIEAAGASLIFLPPYSPDFNPIENGFSKLKAHLRKASARTLDTLEAAVATALKTFQPDECANFFAHAGYGSLL
jgi:transposase